MPRPRAERPTYSLTKRPDTRGGYRYYVQWWEDGAARRVSCRTTKLPEAKRFLADFEAGRATVPPPAAPTIGAILDAYRTERELKPHSPTLGYTVKHLRDVLGDLGADMLTKERVQHYMRARRRMGAGGASRRKQPRPLSDSTLRRELLTLRAALRWAEKAEWIAAAPHVDAPPPGEARDRWLTREEADRLVAGARQLHIRAFIALALYTAGRAGALLELTWDRVDFERGIVNLGAGQGNKKRAIVPLHPELRPVLSEAREARTSDRVIEHGGEAVASVKVGFRNAVTRAGLSGVTPHVLRHTAATWMAHEGVPMAEIAGFLGNSAAVVERVYAHHHPDHMKRAAAALSRKPGPDQPPGANSPK